MAQQTAVEWLYNDLFPKKLDGFSIEEWSKIDKAFEQAKEMEKQQKIDFAFDAYCKISELMGVQWNQISENKMNFEQFYNETYNK